MLPRMTTMDAVVERVPAERARLGLQLLGLNDQQISGILDQTLDLAGLFWARRQDVAVGAVWAQVMPGRWGSLWPAETVASETGKTAKALMAAACQHLVDGRVRMAQAVVAQQSAQRDRLLAEFEFVRTTELLFLVCQGPDLSHAATRNTDLTFEPYSAEKRARLESLLQRTYEGTMDCPQLNGVRSIADTLDGYRQTGIFDERRWLFVQHAGQDVGCLLLADHPQHEQWELVYMGLVPSARGRGWGVDVTRHALWLTRRAGRSRLVLAVDAENAPALEMYALAGFRSWDRRSVYLRFLDND